MQSESFSQKMLRYKYLADYYKYTDPEKHLYFYKKFYMYFFRWTLSQNQAADRNNNRAHIRFLHASPDANEIDIYVNDEMVLKKFYYKNSSDYLDLDAGVYEIDIFPEGTKNAPIYSKKVNVAGGNSYTLAAAGLLDELQLIRVEDDSFVPDSEAKIRVWHLSQDTPSIDIAVKKGDVIFPDIAFTDITDYLALTPMTVDLEVRIAESNELILPLNRVNISPDSAYTIVVVGGKDEQAELEAVFLVP